MHPEETQRSDMILLTAVAVLVIIGLLMIYSASSFRAEEKYGDANIFLFQHLVRVFIGLVIMLVASKIDYHRYRWITPFLFLGLTAFLVLVLFEDKINGSRRALTLMGKDFQPSEFMKLTVILYLAAVFGKKWNKQDLPEDNVMVHYTIVLLVVGLIFLEPDLGTALVIFSVALVMFFIGGVTWRTIGRMGVILIPIVIVGLSIFSYQLKRLTDFLESVLGSGEMSYQVKQSIIGLAQGGLTGQGYGAGRQKLFFLPEPFSDFILASLGEEMGLLGITLVFVLMTIILWRGLKIARNAPDRYGSLIAGGITSLIMINGLINAGVVVNLLPTTGLPFPFLSYGGSSLLVLLVGVGIMLNISKQRPVSLKSFTRRRAQDWQSAGRANR